MATATISAPVKVLPPGPERPDLHFDLHIGIRPNQPVHVAFDGTGFQSNGLSFDDYARMGSYQHKLAPCRRLETPEWAVNEELMAKLVTRYLEMRAGIRKPQRLSLLARIHKAEELLREHRPLLKDRMAKLCKQFVTSKNAGESAARLRALEVQIKNLDKILLSTEQGFAHKVVGIIFYYFRCGCDSVETAQRLGLNPPAVRQTLWRLNRIWERLAKEKDMPLDLPKEKDKPRGLPKIIFDVAVARAEGATFRDIGVRFAMSTSAAFQYVKKAQQAGIRIDDYASYIRYAARVGVEPMPYETWRMLEPQCKPQLLRKHQVPFAIA